MKIIIGKNLYEGETFFSRKITTIKLAEKGQLFIDRIYARGGMVVVEYLDYNKNISDTKYLTPEECQERLLTLADLPEAWKDERLIPAIIKATRAAKQQTVDGYSATYQAEDWDVETLAREMEEQIKQERIDDPELHEEMCKIEREQGMPEFILPKRRKKSDPGVGTESVLPDVEAVSESVPETVV